MGQPKALLDWHGQTAVEHAVAVVREGVGGGPVVRRPCAGAGAAAARRDRRRRRRCPRRARSRRSTRASWRSTGEADVAFACGVDTPLLAPAFVRAVLRSLRKGDDAVVPVDRRPCAAAARRLPGRASPRGSQALLDDGACGLRDIPRTCAVRAGRRAGAARGPRARRRRSAAALGREREHAGGVGGARGDAPSRRRRLTGSTARRHAWRPTSSTSPLSTSTCRRRRARRSSRPSGAIAPAVPASAAPTRTRRPRSAFRRSSSSASPARPAVEPLGVALLELAPARRRARRARSNGRPAAIRSDVAGSRGRRRQVVARPG